MQVRAKFVNEAKPGKKFGSIVGEDDTRYPCPAALVGQFIKGHVYEVAIKNETWDGKAVQIVQSASPLTPANQPAGGGGNGGDHSGLTEAEMRFISNVVGQAILAKTINDPMTISVWAKAARNTLKELA